MHFLANGSKKLYEKRKCIQLSMTFSIIKEQHKVVGTKTYFKSNSDSRPGAVITGLSNSPPPLPGADANTVMRTLRLMHDPPQSKDLSPAVHHHHHHH